eukprot:2942760-Amphidinium_carterae.1
MDPDPLVLALTQAFLNTPSWPGNFLVVVSTGHTRKVLASLIPGLGVKELAQDLLLRQYQQQSNTTPIPIEVTASQIHGSGTSSLISAGTVVYKHVCQHGCPVNALYECEPSLIIQSWMFSITRRLLGAMGSA